jgi:hypothetical protein
MGEDGDAQIARDVHAGGLHEVIAGEESGGTGEEENAEKDEEGQDGGPTDNRFRDDEIKEPGEVFGMIPVGEIDDPTGERGEDEREERDQNDEKENARQLGLVGAQKNAGPEESAQNLGARMFTGHW